MIVDARSADVRMAKPLLHLGDVGLMVERVGGGGRAQRVRADLESERGGVTAHQLVDTVGRDRAVHRARGVVANRTEQRTMLIGAVSGGVEVFMDERIAGGM